MIDRGTARVQFLGRSIDVVTAARIVQVVRHIQMRRMKRRKRK